jgi:rhodanese-related sulfurtransferase
VDQGARAAIDRVLDLLVDRPGDAVLALGAGDWPLLTQLRQRGVTVEQVDGDWPAVQLSRRYEVVLVHPRLGAPAERRDAVLHCAVRHAGPGSLLVTAFADGAWDDPGRPGTGGAVERFELTEVDRADLDGAVLLVHRRTDRFTVHDLLAAARASVDRLTPAELADRLGGPRPPTVVDTRTHTDRARFGTIPVAVHLPRTVLEWHLDPSNGYRHPQVRSLDQPLVVVCNGGYSSTLAAANLVVLGFTEVADLIGGHHAWAAAGLPVVEADHSHLGR